MAADWAKAFYNSKAWKSLRRLCLKRDRYTCQMCGARAEEVHHTITLSPDNIHDKHIALNIDLLESLCHACHTRITRQGECGYYFDAQGYLVEIPPRGSSR